MVHKFFTHQLDPRQTGWDWLSVQFGDNRATYPIHWRIAVPNLGIELEATTPLASQEFVGASRFLPDYWEGAIALSGSHDAKPLLGVGYLEMTGCDRPVQLSP